LFRKVLFEMFENFKNWWAKEKVLRAEAKAKRLAADQEERQRWRCRYKVWQDENGEWCWMAFVEGIKRSPIPEYLPHTWGGEKFEVVEGSGYQTEDAAKKDAAAAKQEMLSRWEAKQRRKTAQALS
jgi:hypothetical protein